LFWRGRGEGHLAVQEGPETAAAAADAVPVVDHRGRWPPEEPDAGADPLRGRRKEGRSDPRILIWPEDSSNPLDEGRWDNRANGWAGGDHDAYGYLDRGDVAISGSVMIGFLKHVGGRIDIGGGLSGADAQDPCHQTRRELEPRFLPVHIIARALSINSPRNPATIWYCGNQNGRNGGIMGSFIGSFCAHEGVVFFEPF